LQAGIAEGVPEAIEALVVIANQRYLSPRATVQKNPLHLHFVHVLSFVDQQPADRKRWHDAVVHVAYRA
jgi:hypothetical protein